MEERARKRKGKTVFRERKRRIGERETGERARATLRGLPCLVQASAERKGRDIYIHLHSHIYAHIYGHMYIYI